MKTNDLYRIIDAIIDDCIKAIEAHEADLKMVKGIIEDADPDGVWDNASSLEFLDKAMHLDGGEGLAEWLTSYYGHSTYVKRSIEFDPTIPDPDWEEDKEE